MKTRSNLQTKTVSGLIKAINQTDLRSNVMLMFGLFYGVYFGFFIGLPLILNFSYMLATVWLMILGLAGCMMVFKIGLIVYSQARAFLYHIRSKTTHDLLPSGWNMQSAR